jgi:hypothetical protein
VPQLLQGNRLCDMQRKRLSNVAGAEELDNDEIIDLIATSDLGLVDTTSGLSSMRLFYICSSTLSSHQLILRQVNLESEVSHSGKFWIKDGWIWGPEMSGKFWIEDDWIWGPKNSGKYWIDNNWIWGPKSGGKFWIQDGWIWGPSDTRLPWLD